MNYQVDPNLLQVYATVFGEEAKGNENNIKLAASSVFNRLDSGRVEEFGSNLDEITAKGYYARINQNTPYRQAMSNQFPDKVSEENFKKVIQIVGGIASGTIERVPGLFFFKDEEIQQQEKDKSFDFSKTTQVGETDTYKAFEYSGMTIQRALKKAGFDPGKIDGYIGDNSIKAIKDFQKEKGLVPDGKVGKKTRKALGI